jgi:hypothetical protein
MKSTNNGSRRWGGIVEGSVFYWVCWSVWVIFTFIINKQNPYRLKITAFILVLLILANFHCTIAGFNFNMGGLFLLFLSYSLTYKKQVKTITYFFICSFIVTIAYVSFRLFEISDPVWIIFNKDWMIGIICCFLAILLQKRLKDRLLIIASGTMQGEILYGYMLDKYDFSYLIGSLDYLDIFSCSAVLLIGWSCLENASFYFENNFNIGQKGKQKSS